MYDLAGAITEFQGLAKKEVVRRAMVVQWKALSARLVANMGGKKSTKIAMNSVDYMCLCWKEGDKMEYLNEVSGLEIIIIDQLPDGMVVTG